MRKRLAGVKQVCHSDKMLHLAKPLFEGLLTQAAEGYQHSALTCTTSLYFEQNALYFDGYYASELPVDGLELT